LVTKFDARRLKCHTATWLVAAECGAQTLRESSSQTISTADLNWINSRIATECCVKIQTHFEIAILQDFVHLFEKKFIAYRQTDIFAIRRADILAIRPPRIDGMSKSVINVQFFYISSVIFFNLNRIVNILSTF